MEAIKILQSDLLDIIFEGRNKAYGAYDLRRSYKRRFWIALGVTFISILIFEAAVLFSARLLKPDTGYIVREITPESFRVKELPPQHRNILSLLSANMS